MRSSYLTLLFKGSPGTAGQPGSPGQGGQGGKYYNFLFLKKTS